MLDGRRACDHRKVMTEQRLDGWLCMGQNFQGAGGGRGGETRVSSLPSVGSSCGNRREGGRRKRAWERQGNGRQCCVRRRTEREASKTVSDIRTGQEVLGPGLPEGTQCTTLKASPFPSNFVKILESCFLIWGALLTTFAHSKGAWSLKSSFQ